MAISTLRLNGQVVLVVDSKRITIRPSQLQDVIAVLQAEAE